MSKFDLVLFDADGTLFNYDMAEGFALKKVFEHHQFEYSDDIRDSYREINSQMWIEFEHGRISKAELQTFRFENLLEKCKLKADATNFNSLYLDFLAEGGYLTDGALEVCKELSKYCTLAIATNGIARVQKSRLKSSVINQYIKHIIVSEDAGYQKPQKDFFEYAFKTCEHIDKGRAIIVGDSLNADIKGGIDFGISTCWYNPKCEDINIDLKVDYEIRDLSELIEIIL